MPKGLSDENNPWPSLFNSPRQFPRLAENKTYIEFIRHVYDEGEDDDADTDGKVEEDDEDDSDNCVLDEEQEDVVQKDVGQITEEKWNNDQKFGTCKNHYNVRRFMEGMTGDYDVLFNQDKVDEVAGFCEQSCCGEFKISVKQDRKHILVDDRNVGGTITDKKGFCRPHLGSLTSQELQEALTTVRFYDDYNRNGAPNASDNKNIDVERRLIYATDPDPSTVEAIIMTASVAQASALKDLLYKYLAGKTSVGVTIPSQGFMLFTLDFHIPYFALRYNDELKADTRSRFKGEPLRKSQPLYFLNSPTNAKALTSGVYYLHESQISVSVTGIDNWVWTAYAFVDTYFESKETVQRYQSWKGHRNGRADPLSGGCINADEPIWTPREYYCKLLEIRTKQVLNEWGSIFTKIQEEIERSRTTHIFPLPPDDPENGIKVRELSKWNNYMVDLLTKLRGPLSDSIRGWEKFCRTDIAYFPESEPLRPRSPLKSSVDAVKTAYSEMSQHLQKLDDIREELHKASPYNLHGHLILGSNEAAIFQQKAARHLEALTALTMVFFPLALSANLFSTTDVLPFKPNLVKFVYMLLALTLLVVMTLVVISKWRLWSDQVLACLSTIFNCGSDHRNTDERDEEVLATATRILKLNIKLLSSNRLRKPRSSNRWDLEKGPEEADLVKAKPR